MQEIPTLIMDTLNDTTRSIDLQFLGRSGVIATGVLDTADGLLLVDPGPSTCLGTLQAELRAAGIGGRDLHGLLITHIHLDHAGASGSLLRLYPHLTVYVHERGAPHMADPSKLVSSAERLYGADMDRLWGEIAAVPGDRIRALQGGESLAFGPRRIRIAYTPGHASHHVSYFDAGTGIAFTGDTAGIRVGTLPYVLPPTPPPDIDLDAWQGSLDVIRGWRPSGLFVTHFGLKTDVDAHLGMLAAELEAWGHISAGILDRALIGDERGRAFVTAVHERIRERVGDASSEAYAAAVPFEHCWMGLDRYWQKRAARRAT